MPTFEIQTPDGRTFEIDGPDQQGAVQALQRHLSANGGYGVQQKDTLLGDVAKSGAAGVVRGGAGLLGTPAALRDVADQIAVAPARLYNKVFGSGTFDVPPSVQQAREDYAKRNTLAEPSAQDIIGGVESVTGKLHEPQTTAGKYARTIGEFLPAAAVAPGGVAGNLLKYGVAPGIASEAAGQATEGTALEPWARAGAGLAAIPLASMAGNRIAEALAPADALSAMPRPVRQYVQKQTDPARLQQYQQQMDELGPNAMLADVSEEFKGMGGAAASRVDSRGAIVDALNARDAGKNARLRSAMDTELGPAPLKADLEKGIAASQETLGPQYKEVFRNASRVNTKPIADALDTSIIDLRGDAQKAMQRVRGMLNVHGTDQLDPNPQTLFQTRQAIDDMLSTETAPKAVRALSEIRQRVDETLASAVPGIKDVDAKFAELARQKEGIQTGVQALDSGREALPPQQFSREFTDAANPQGTMVGPSAVPVRMRQGARAEIERIVGTKANDVNALQSLLKGEGDWNRDKLRTLFGQDKADRILKVVDAEKVMQNTRNSIVGNSATEQRRQGNKFLDDMASGSQIPTDSTVAGATARGAQKLVQSLMKANGEEKAAEAAKAFGKLAVANGPERDAIVQALLARTARQQQGKGAGLTVGAAAILRALGVQ